MDDKEVRNYDILWDEAEFSPSIQLKFGTKRKVFPLTRQFTRKRDTIYYVNNYVELKGKWINVPNLGSQLSLTLKNISDSSIRITRLVFPAENGFDKFLKVTDLNKVTFLRNGYQSWSTSRSYYVIKDRPLRPWLQLVSLASSNMANLPSNTPGLLSSDMFSVVTDLATDRSFLIGQGLPFDQFFYIKLYFYKRKKKTNYFELVFDFGRKMVLSGETIKLDGIILGLGNTHELLQNYFKFLSDSISNQRNFSDHITGWSSWYCFYKKITPDKILRNLEKIKEKALPLTYIQIDDGYQKYVGDWLDLSEGFQDKMKLLADKIKEAGFKPGLWIAPFIADRESTLAKEHPEYLLRNEFGKPMIAGYNPLWKGNFYYALDVTNPRFEEYLRKVIHTIVHKWGFELLKLDFLYAACLRGATYHELSFSRAEVLKYGIKLIREEAGDKVKLLGCGMPISAGIGLVDIMRVGPDTAPVWKKISGRFLQTSSMMGARNSIRNFIVRSPMNKYLWINDPDCMMIRRKKTRLNKYQRETQINAIILAGGLLFFSDDMTSLEDEDFELINKIIQLSSECYKGDSIPVDLMEKEIPEIYYNTKGYLGIFNFRNRKIDKKIFINRIINTKKINRIIDVWTNEEVDFSDNVIEFKNMPSHSSKLLFIELA